MTQKRYGKSSIATPLTRLILDLHALRVPEAWEANVVRVPCPTCKALPGMPCVSAGQKYMRRGEDASHTKRQDIFARIYNGMSPAAWIDDLVVYGKSPAEVLEEVLRSPGYKFAVKRGLLRALEERTITVQPRKSALASSLAFAGEDLAAAMQPDHVGSSAETEAKGYARAMGEVVARCEAMAAKSCPGSEEHHALTSLVNWASRDHVTESPPP